MPVTSKLRSQRVYQPPPMFSASSLAASSSAIRSRKSRMSRSRLSPPSSIRTGPFLGFTSFFSPSTGRRGGSGSLFPLYMDLTEHLFFFLTPRKQPLVIYVYQVKRPFQRFPQPWTLAASGGAGWVLRSCGRVSPSHSS